MTTGWPGRAGRSAYGVTMRDERPTVNSETEVNKDQMNLSFWQLGAMGLAAPKATMFWGPPGDAPAELRDGNFSWDQVIYENVALGSLPSYILSYVVNGTGDYTLTFDNEVLGRPDSDGVPQLEVLDFQFAIAGVNLQSGGASAVCEVTLVNPQTFDIQVRRNGFNSNQPYALAVW